MLGSTLQNIRESIKENNQPRIIILQILLMLLCFILLRQLWKLQIVEGEAYAENFELKITKTIVEKGARGNIYDCNGSILASNQLVYTITMTDDGVYESNRERQLTLNSIIYRLRKKLHQNGDRLYNEFKIMVNADGEYEYTADGAALLRFKADIFGVRNPDEMSEEQSAMSASEMIQYLSGEDQFALYGTKGDTYTADELARCGLPEKFAEEVSKEEILDIVGIRYMLSLYSYRQYQAVTIARNISPETMAYVLENKAVFPGIEVEEDWERVYQGGEAFAHILGYIGSISAEELETLKLENAAYSMDSVVGKAGIEQYFEAELQGTDGERTVIVNNVGRIVEEGEVLQKASVGNDVYLSIDKDLQTATYQILEQTLAGILSSNLIDAKYFDKTKIADSVQIRIPVFDVYMALIENNIISIPEMKQENVSDLEKEVAEKIILKKQAVQEQLLSELTDAPHAYGTLSEEMKEYLSFVVQDSGLISEEAPAEADSAEIVWDKAENSSLKDFLYECLGNGWIDLHRLEHRTKYSTAEETYALAVDYILQWFRESQSVEKILLKNMLYNGELSERDFCRLLYKQEILAIDDDYEAFLKGEIRPFALIKKKIDNVELTPAQLALDPCSASAVVVQADTGKILACVTYPGYDNNRLTNKIDSEYYNRLLQDKALPLYNRATQQLTAPGSTLKPVTVIAGLQEGVIEPNTAVVCDGVFDKVTPSLRCWRHSGHGTVSNAAAAIQNSCNDYLCDISYRLGQQETGVYDDGQALAYLQKYAVLFDLDKKSGVEIVESSPHVTQKYGIPSAIGQGTHNYTTVQLARYMNTLAARGTSFQLSVVKGIGGRNESGNVIECEPVIQSTVHLDEETWDTVWQGMNQFAQNNSVLKDMKISVAGKTGTAQESKTRPDHALFIGCAPAENPEIAIAVRIANGYGSSNATHAGRDIINYYFGLESRETILNGKASEANNSRSD
ncbi:MAG: peptidase [Lachnospiraceae bacterium]|nr:peptidase [Lachnospiraceae bacterium]